MIDVKGTEAQVRAQVQFQAEIDRVTQAAYNKGFSDGQSATTHEQMLKNQIAMLEANERQAASLERIAEAIEDLNHTGIKAYTQPVSHG